MNYTLSQETLNKVLSVLANMPYSQVADVIASIQADVSQLPNTEVNAEPENIE